MVGAGRREHRLRVHVLVGGTHGLPSAGHTAPRELADLHFGLGVEGDAERVWGARRLGVDLPEVVEDGVGLLEFFLGLVFWTRRRR